MFSSDYYSAPQIVIDVKRKLPHIELAATPQVLNLMPADDDDRDVEQALVLRQPAMATTLAPVDSREVVRCDRCQLVQFRTTNNLCRRCRTCLDPEEVVAPPPIAIPSAPPAPRPPHMQVALAIRMLRQRGGLSQRQLAARMNVPRTYVSKIENEKATPTLSSLERLARALEVQVPDLLKGGVRSKEDEIRDLMADDFIAEIVPFVSRLNGMQWANILGEVRNLTLNPRRSS
jgi:transcriptional regulator with XRE-family HTH domain